MKNFDSLSLYNDWTEEPTENAGRKYVFRNDTGVGSTAVYSVFPGIELLYAHPRGRMLAGIPVGVRPLFLCLRMR